MKEAQAGLALGGGACDKRGMVELPVSHVLPELAEALVSRRMAVLQARGQLGVGDAFTGLSILGSAFQCRIESLTDLAGVPAIVPSLSGRGWITEVKQLLCDPDDPWPRGYRVGDTWPMH